MGAFDGVLQIIKDELAGFEVFAKIALTELTTDELMLVKKMATAELRNMIMSKMTTDELMLLGQTLALQWNNITKVKEKEMQFWASLSSMLDHLLDAAITAGVNSLISELGQ